MMNTKISSFANVDNLRNCRVIGNPNKISLVNSQIFVNSNNGDNLLIFEDDVKLVNSNIIINGSGNVVYFSSNKHNYMINLTVNNNNCFFIGNDNYINGNINVICSESQNVIIGNDGLFSFGIWIRNADPHPIYNINNKTRINLSESVYIGDHVWLGQSSTVLKGCKIGSGSIFGTMSVLTGKRYLSNCIYAGNPAKMIKENCFFIGECVHNWNKELTEKHMIYNADMWIYDNDIDSINYEKMDELLYNCRHAEERYELLLENIVINKGKSRFCIKRKDEQTCAEK